MQRFGHLIHIRKSIEPAISLLKHEQLVTPESCYQVVR